MPIDDILNLHSRFFWTLADPQNLRANNSLYTTLAGGVTIAAGTGIFASRPVTIISSGFVGGIVLPSGPTAVDKNATNFNTWFNESFTFGIWVNGTIPTTGNWPILASVPVAATNYEAKELLSIFIKDQKACFSFYGYDTEGTITIPSSAWTFLVFTYDANEGVQSIYVNGKLDNQTFNIPPLAANLPLAIGEQTLSTGKVYATGQIADMFVINDVFSRYQNSNNL